MKKFTAIALVLTMALSLFAGCGNGAATETEAPSDAVVSVEGTMEELLNKVTEQNPVEFMGGVMTVDLTDTSEDGLWNLKRFTGLENADMITEAAAFEPMMGSIAFSMVMARAAEGVDTKTLAEAMKIGIDPRKWVCVEANDIKVCGYGDVVMFIMLDTETGLTAQSFVDAFQSVVGAELDFVI